MHSLSFQLLLLIVIFLLALVVGPGWPGGCSWLSPVHLFMHMRGAYQRPAVRHPVRMDVPLDRHPTIGFSLLAVLWVILGANAMAGH